MAPWIYCIRSILHQKICCVIYKSTNSWENFCKNHTRCPSYYSKLFWCTELWSKLLLFLSVVNPRICKTMSFYFCSRLNLYLKQPLCNKWRQVGNRRRRLVFEQSLELHKNNNSNNQKKRKIGGCNCYSGAYTAIANL